MPQQTEKIQGKFYPLTVNKIGEFSSNFPKAELKTRLDLKVLHPFTNRYKELDTSQMAEHLFPLGGLTEVSTPVGLIDLLTVTGQEVSR